MRRRDDDKLDLRPGTPRGKKPLRAERFITQVLKAAGNARMRGVGKRRSVAFGRRQSIGRGATVARLMRGSLGRTSRRVIVKARLVNLSKAGLSTTLRHLRYLQREGMTRDGVAAQAYGPQVDEADTLAFEERGRGDRHQFRFIVSPEDGTELGDLRSFTRSLMAQVERDLGTRLDWVAVDHWDTDNPHSHIVLRGKTDRGEDLVIAREYISEGMRTRAGELATEWLGRRTEREIRERLGREVAELRWTGLDRSLQRLAEDGRVDLRVVPEDTPTRLRRSLLVGRLQRLTEAGLAEPREPGVWRLGSEFEPTLRALEERAEISKRVQRALGGEPRQWSEFDPATAATSLTGRIAGRGLADEFTERGYLVVEGVEGRTHYVGLGPATDLSQLPPGGIVEIRPRTAPRAADKTIADVAEQGIYFTSRHREDEQRRARPGQDPEAFVEAHVRRLEALRRAGIVERVADGIWRVPADLPEQGFRYDAARYGGVEVTLRSALPIERQARVLGATWLDAQLLDGAREVGGGAFGLDVRAALKERVGFLVEQRLAEQHGQGLSLARNLLATLRGRELDATGARIAAETGRPYRRLADGQPVSGMLGQSLQLASGRFAMLDDGQGFSLVPWHPLLERQMNRVVHGMVHGDSVSWQLGRSRGISR